MTVFAVVTDCGHAPQEVDSLWSSRPAAEVRQDELVRMKRALLEDDTLMRKDVCEVVEWPVDEVRKYALN